MRPLHAARGLLYGLGALLWGAYGLWVWLCGPRPRLPLLSGEVARILVIRLDLLGDVVLSIPALDALAASYPEAHIDVLALPYTAPILARVGSVNRVFALDVNRFRRPAGWTEIGVLLRTIAALRKRQYDLVVGLSGLLGGVFAVLSGARWRVGYSDETYRGAYNIPVPGRRYRRRQHEVDYGLDLVRALRGGTLPAADVPEALRAHEGPGAAPGRAPSLPADLADRYGPSARPYAVLVPGASNGAAKRWPLPYWSALGDRLNRDLGLEVVLSGAASERALVDAVSTGMSMPVDNLVGQTSLESLTKLLAFASIVVAGDTGPLHLAAAVGAPVVGIFGPTDPRNSGPRSARAAVLRLDLSCSPCYDLRSPADCKLPDRSMPCMWGISPDRVFATVQELLQGRARADGA